MKLNFGKHGDKEICDVPRDYMEWLLKQNNDVNKILNAELDRRDMLESEQMPTIEKMIHAGYRRMCERAHPDQGGSTTEFLAVKAAYEQLKIILAEMKDAGIVGEKK